MKEELEKYGKGDLVLCKNGVYVLVVSVDPLSKLKRHDGERYLEYMKGFSSKSTKKSNLFDSDAFCFERIDNVNDLHDIAIYIAVGDSYIEEYDALYWEMCSLIEQETDYIINYVNEFIDEKFQSYYGDPAFASEGDYWGYILG